ncbi:MAG: GTP 3',8-cyclase MoaA [Desulfurococcales archaeon]|nr:GTP 3',8-cyclase MoaA [Desulfurococcales archaeon]
MLIDRFGRPLQNLRVSVANECNYRCIFCHLEGSPLHGPLPLKEVMDKKYLEPDDYAIIAEAAARLDIAKVKITGGEPLIRHDIIKIVRSFKEHGKFDDISMTTNGFRLAILAQGLREAGLDRVNISIHSLKEERYKYITGVPGLSNALKALDASIDAGFRAVKVNMVVMKNVNEDEIPEFIELAAKKGFTLQLIELHPVGLGKSVFKKHYIPLDTIERYLKQRAIKMMTRKDLHNRPIYILDNNVKVEIVRPYNNWRFCMGCTRIRISPEGFLYPCINWHGPRIGLLDKLREPGTREEKVLRVMEAIERTNMLREPYFKPPSKTLPLGATLTKPRG